MTNIEKAQHTPGAMRAAKKIALSDKIRQLALGIILRQTFADDIAQTISRETGDAELLEASTEFLTMIEEDYGWNEKENCGCELDGFGNHAPLCPAMKLRAAIRKARGEQP